MKYFVHNEPPYWFIKIIFKGKVKGGQKGGRDTNGKDLG